MSVLAVTQSAICALNEVEGGRDYMPCIILVVLLCYALKPTYKKTTNTEVVFFFF